MELLRDTALDLGARTRRTALDAAEGMQQLAQAGFSVQQTVEAIPGVLLLADAGVISLAKSASVAVSTLASFNLTTAETGRVVDILAKTSATSKTTVDSLANSLRYSATTASTAGISLSETAAAIGLLGNAGLEGSIAGTSLNAAMVQMVKRGEALGVTFTDTTGKLRPLNEIVSDLGSRSVTTQQMVQTFGIRGARAMITLQRVGGDALRKYSESLNDVGFAAELAEAKNDTMAASVDALFSRINTLAILMGDKFRPATRGVLDNAIIPLLDGVIALDRGIGFVDTKVAEVEASLNSMGDTILNTVTGSVGEFVDFLGGAANDALGLFNSTAEATTITFGNLQTGSRGYQRSFPGDGNRRQADGGGYPGGDSGP